MCMFFFKELFQDLSQMQEQWLSQGEYIQYTYIHTYICIYIYIYIYIRLLRCIYDIYIYDYQLQLNSVFKFFPLHFLQHICKCCMFKTFTHKKPTFFLSYISSSFNSTYNHFNRTVCLGSVIVYSKLAFQQSRYI